MRIIGGTKKGLLIQAPSGLPVRPTTDRAKESLFNILENRIDIEGLEVLDLFAGTGNMSFEFASRGAIVTSIDLNYRCVSFIKSGISKFGFNTMKVYKKDAFSFLKQNTHCFDLVFADPPYAMPKFPELIQLLMQGEVLKKDGLFICEHASTLNVSREVGFSEDRVYGQSTFSFFVKK